MSLDLSKYINPLPSDSTWVKYLIASSQKALREGLRLYIIAVARKMARLVESFRVENKDLDYLLELNEVEFITEHAIPFSLRNANANNSDVIILDDLIVLGDTVDTISEQVFALTGIKPKIIAMAASDKAFTSNKFGKSIFPIFLREVEGGESLGEKKLREEYILSRDLIPAFTARNSDRILALKKPIDLEFTILESERKHSDMSIHEYIVNILEPCIRKAFPKDVVYKITHKLNGKNGTAESITVVLNRDVHMLSNNDFAKLRFFVSDKSLRVVCYTPNIWNEADLRGRIFGFEMLQSCWDLVNGILNEQVVSTMYDEADSYDKVLLLKKYAQRKKMSAIVLANYFKSFENLMLLKDCISKVLDNAIASPLEDSLFISDLKLLSGEGLSKKIFPLLKEILKHSQFSPSEIIMGKRICNAPTSLIPAEEKEEYNRRVNFGIAYSGNIPVALSLLFTTLWDMFGMINNSKREDRIAVGETFQSLEERVALSYNKNKVTLKEIRLEVNRWIDSRIDLGVVVPKYEGSLDRLGDRMWRRYFRAGEREDNMVDIARVFYLITRNEEESNEINLYEFISRIVPLFNELNIVTGNTMSLDDFDNGLLRIGLEETAFSNLWVYLVLAKAYELLDRKTWQEIKLNEFEDGIPVYSKTALYSR